MVGLHFYILLVCVLGISGVLTVNVPSKLRPGDVNGLTSYAVSGGTHVAIEYCPVGRDSTLNCVLRMRLQTRCISLSGLTRVKSVIR